MAKHLVKNWKGSRASYNFLKANNAIDAWTKYFVIDTVDSATTVTEYFGLNPVSDKCGDFAAVNDIVQEPPLNLNPYDRFLVGTDATGYKIYEYTPGFVHAKAMICDDIVAGIGTVNLDYRSLFLHYECSSIFYKSKIIFDLKNDYLKTQSECTEIVKENWNFSASHRFIDNLLRLIAPLL